jgi:hypothetical protein
MTLLVGMFAGIRAWFKRHILDTSKVVPEEEDVLVVPPYNVVTLSPEALRMRVEGSEPAPRRSRSRRLQRACRSRRSHRSVPRGSAWLRDAASAVDAANKRARAAYDALQAKLDSGAPVEECVPEYEEHKAALAQYDAAMAPVEEAKQAIYTSDALKEHDAVAAQETPVEVAVLPSEQ